MSRTPNGASGKGHLHRRAVVDERGEVTQLRRIGVARRSLAEIEDVTEPTACGENVGRAAAGMRRAGKDERGIEVALHGTRAAEPIPGGREVLPRVDPDDR